VGSEHGVATRPRALACLVCEIVALMGLLAGLVPTSAQAMSARAYATNLNGQNLLQFGVGAGGLLSALSPATVESGIRPLGVAVSPWVGWVNQPLGSRHMGHSGGPPFA
jgi:hypothetical protein